jgi:hypothetical protein
MSRDNPYVGAADPKTAGKDPLRNSRDMARALARGDGTPGKNKATKKRKGKRK